MIPDDPYGKNGPSLDVILHKLKVDANVDENYIEVSKDAATTTTTIITPTTTTTTTATANATVSSSTDVINDANATIILTDNESSLIVCDD